MAKILLLQGSSMGLFGIRQPKIYGTVAAAELDRMLKNLRPGKAFKLEIFYTNSEGEYSNRIIKAYANKLTSW